jgi:hypothetical protein
MTTTAVVNTRYLVKTPATTESPDGGFTDALVMESTPSGAVLRVVWVASVDGVSFPAKQEWIARGKFEDSIVEVLPPSLSQINRARTTAGLRFTGRPVAPNAQRGVDETGGTPTPKVRVP